MSRSGLGEVKTVTIRKTLKNGNIYVYERQVRYNPDTKNNCILSSTLIGKILAGTTEIISTRPKSPPGTNKNSQKKRISNSNVSNTVISDSSSSQEGELNNSLLASNSGEILSSNELSDMHITRTSTGMMDILEHIGKVSGIDDALYSATDLATAQKIISLARYIVSNNGVSLPGIFTWQLRHPLPYAEGITEGIYHQLFHDVGMDEDLQQRYFMSRCNGLQTPISIAFDSTTVSTYSNDLIDARYGYNKDGDGLKTVKFLTLYAIENRQPIAFTKLPGNIADVSTIKNALNQLSMLPLEVSEIITDNGYYSQKNVADILYNGFNLITLAKVSLKWISPHIPKNRDEFSCIENQCPFDPYLYGKTIEQTREFSVRQEFDEDNQEKTGSREENRSRTIKFKRKIYLHIYFDIRKFSDERARLDTDIQEVKKAIEAGSSISSLDTKSQSIASKYLIVHKDQPNVVFFNKDAREKAEKYFGYWALVASKEQDKFEALKRYRKREFIESFFEEGKQIADGKRTRVQDSYTLRGRSFVQFVALCYYEYIANILREAKKILGQPNGDKKHDTQKIIDEEKKLLSWIKNTPLYIQLQWFDTQETVSFKTPFMTKRWTTENTIRDRMYLELLGMS